LQLAHKKKTVQLAYKRYFGLDPALLPDVKDTIASPKQWGYRTKITPHFDAPPKWAKGKLEGVAEAKTNVDDAISEEGAMNGVAQGPGGEDSAMKAEEGKANGNANGAAKTWECRIGFERKGRPGVMDIEVGPAPRQPDPS
jgi:tRNA (uracil-5-)-methyltransferase